MDSARLSRLLCPPYDVIDADERAQLLAADPDNAVGLILPEATDGGDPYLQAAQRLDRGSPSGLLATDAEPGALRLRDAGTRRHDDPRPARCRRAA